MNNLVFISQPMKGKSKEEILVTREKAVEALKRKGIGVLAHSSFTEPLDESLYDGLTPLYMLGDSLKQMSCASAVYFCKGWESARGCRIEHAAASEYGLKIIYEEQK